MRQWQENAKPLARRAPMRAVWRLSTARQPGPGSRGGPGAEAGKGDAAMRSVRRLGPAGAPALPVIAALASAALTGCGNTLSVRDVSTAGHPAAHAAATTIVCAHAGQVDRLTMSRVNMFPQDHEQFTFPAQVTVTGAQRAQAAARALCALPLFPRGPMPMSCPMDWGVSYLLSFASGASRFQVVSVDPSGCELVDGLGPTRWAASDAFWHLLGAAAGITHPGNAAFRGSTAS